MNSLKSQSRTNIFEITSRLTVDSPSTRIADAANAWCPPFEVFADSFRDTVSSLLARRGLAVPQAISAVLTAAYAHVKASGNLDLDQIARALRNEILRVTPEPTRAPTPSLERQLALRRALEGLTEGDLAALRSYYVDGLDEQSVCSRFGVSREEFASMRAGLRARTAACA
jgi:hypothetical protein